MSRRMRGAGLALLLAFSLGLAHAGAREDIQADMKAGRWTQADQRLAEVERKHPENALARFWRAQVKYELRDYAAAQGELAEAERLDPSGKFASNPAVVAAIRRGAPTRPSEAAQRERAQAQAGSGEVVRTPPAALPAPAPEPARESHAGRWWLIGLLLAGGAWWALRRGGRAAAGQERGRWEAALRGAHQDLADAIAANDADAALSPEQKLAQYDRARRAQADIAQVQGTLAGRTQFNDIAEVVARAHDIAADLRGEERPSLRAERERLAAQQANLAQQQGGYGMGGPGYGGPGYGGPGYGRGGSVLGTVAAVGAGVAAGALLAEGVHAATRHDEDLPRRRDDSWSPAGGAGGGGDDLPLDFGGSDDGGSWDSGGGGDFGGGGDGGGSFD